MGPPHPDDAGRAGTGPAQHLRHRQGSPRSPRRGRAFAGCAAPTRPTRRPHVPAAASRACSAAMVRRRACPCLAAGAPARPATMATPLPQRLDLEAEESPAAHGRPAAGIKNPAPQRGVLDTGSALGRLTSCRPCRPCHPCRACRRRRIFLPGSPRPWPRW